jgi:hypothetical protein
LKKNLCVVAAISVCVHLCKHKSVCVYLWVMTRLTFMLAVRW